MIYPLKPLIIHEYIKKIASYKEMEQLLLLGANPNDIDSSKKTALIIAIENDREDLVELLLQYKTNINAQDSKGDTALHYALYANVSNQTIQTLILHGANPLMKNNDNQDIFELVHDCVDETLLGLIRDTLDML